MANEKIAQSKRVLAGSLTIIVSKPQLARTCILRASFLFADAVWCFFGVIFVLICFRFRLFAFIETLALSLINRSSI